MKECNCIDTANKLRYSSQALNQLWLRSGPIKLGRKHFRVTEDFKFTQKEESKCLSAIHENFKENDLTTVGRVIYRNGEIFERNTDQGYAKAVYESG